MKLWESSHDIAKANEKSKFSFLLKRKNAFNISFIIILLVGYSFFLTSNFWLGIKNEGAFTPEGKVIEQEGRLITVESWEVDRKNNILQAILTINNLTDDGIDSYDFKCMSRTGVFLDVDRVFEKDNLVVLNIALRKGNWGEISLRMGWRATDGMPISVKLYANDKMELRDVDAMQEMSSVKWWEKVYNKRISILINDNVLKKSKIKENREKIAVIRKKIYELQLLLSEKTSEESATINENILKLQGDVSMLDTEIYDLESGIKKNAKKIKQQEKLREGVI